MQKNWMKQAMLLVLSTAILLGGVGCNTVQEPAPAPEVPAEEDTPIVLTEPAHIPDRQDGYAAEFPEVEYEFSTLQATEKDLDTVASAMSGETYLEGKSTLEQYKRPVQEGEEIGEMLPKAQTVSTSKKSSTEQVEYDEVKAIWISYLDFATILKGKTEAQFTKNISQAFDNVKDLGLNTVLVQVRPYGDALYPSEYFPWSYIVTGTEGKAPTFDPLAIMVEEAKERDLIIEAWINPYRVRTSDKKEAISNDNPVKKMLKSGDAISYKGGTYYNPASEEARKLIVNGVTEIIENYDVDGIHFDDYFYPTTDTAFDADDYAAYKKAGGKMSLGDWRRENVNILVRDVYAAIQKVDDSVLFGISPQGNMDNNYNQQFIDVALWLSEPGYLDYICPQIYFGFDNAICPYKETVEAWNKLVKLDDISLYVGLAPFKVGKVDTWAGAGKQEWVNNSDLMAKMVSSAREQSSYNGFVLFRYDSVFHPDSGVKKQVNQEIANLKDVLE